MKSNSKRITVKLLTASLMHGHVHTICSHNMATQHVFFIYLFSFIYLAVLPNPLRQLSLWEETGIPGENPRLSAELTFSHEDCMGLSSH